MTIQNIAETIHEHYIELGIVLNDDDLFWTVSKNGWRVADSAWKVTVKGRPNDERQRTVRNGSEREGTVVNGKER